MINMHYVTRRCSQLCFRFGTPTHGPGAGILGLYADSGNLVTPKKDELYGSGTAVSASLTQRAGIVGGPGYGQSNNFSASGQALQGLDPYKLSSQTSLIQTLPANVSPSVTLDSSGYIQAQNQSHYLQPGVGHAYMPVQPY